MSVRQKILDLVRSFLGIKSPSEMMVKESEKMANLFWQGIEMGIEDPNPLLWIDEDGNLRSREFTQEELEAGQYARLIVARAFPGFYDEEDTEDERNKG